MPVTGAPTSAHRPGGCVVDACDACLRRRSLLAGLASWIDIEWRRRGSTSRVLALPDDALLSLGKSRRMAEEYRAFAPAHARQAIADAGLSAWCRCSAGYPDRVRELHDPPAVLHVAGFPEALHQPASVALVGARRATDYGLEVARALGRGLASSGVCVVSGLALGVDSAAHAGAVQGVARPVAVLAGGADVAYPSRMRSLYARVVARGCAVSELPPGFRAHRWCFVARNRVIAALSALTVVIEAAERSGSLTTADFAADLGRAVAAVPGPVTSPLSTGANALIAAGAGLIQDTRDVLDQLSLDGRPCIIEAPEPAGPALEPRLARVLEAVEAGHGTPGQMSAALGDPLAVLAALTELELRGLVRRRLGRSYMRTASGTPSPWHAPGEPLEDRPGPG